MSKFKLDKEIILSYTFKNGDSISFFDDDNAVYNINISDRLGRKAFHMVDLQLSELMRETHKEFLDFIVDNDTKE